MAISNSAFLVGVGNNKRSETIDCDYVYIILRDLRNISDDDAIEVAKMGGKVGSKEFLIHCGKYHATHNHIRPIVDYLRSKSYCLPFMGYDLVKEGIAIIEP